VVTRYAIDDRSVDWSVAETQVANIARGSGSKTVVSVKATGGGQKRKAEEGDIRGDKGDKKATRRGKKVKR
jgi:N-acetyltransferase 10